MSTATSAPAVKTHAQDRFGADKRLHRGITLLSLRGTLNEAFEAKKLAQGITTKKLVITMRDVRRFASWGMSEWMEFLRLNQQRDVYLTECSTYAVSQLNLVTGLLGHAKLVSFFAGYRCSTCSEYSETLHVIPHERDIIRQLPGSERECPTCSGRARLEEYPAAFFDAIADRPTFDVDDEVLAYMRSELGYALEPDLTRFRAYRATKPGYTYLRLSGNLAALPVDALAKASQGTTVVDLGGALFDPDHLAAWHGYIAAATQAKSLQLLDCPVGFFESAITQDDLRDKVRIRSFAQSYECLRCDTKVSKQIDVAEHLEELVSGIVPAQQCAKCQSTLVAIMTPEQSALVRSLPARERDPALEKLVAKSRNEVSDKLEDCLAPVQPAPPSSRKAIPIAIALGSLLVLGLAVVAVLLVMDRHDRPAVVPVAAAPEDAGPTKPTFTRPDWIMSDVPASAFCHDMINRLMCVGVSSYRATREEAVAEANDAALDELVHTVGLKVADPYFRDHVLPAYSDVRTSALSALQAGAVDRTSAEYTKAAEVVREGRKRVAELLRVSGGAAVPAQRTDWYWEEYAGDNGKANELLVFIRYDVPLDAVRALVDRYSTRSKVRDNEVVTAFPALAWADHTFPGGVMVVASGRALAKAGLEPGRVITAVGSQTINDGVNFASQLETPSKKHQEAELTTRKEGTAETIRIRF